MLRMRLRKFTLDEALDAWSDFAIDCWLYALRFALTLLAVLLFYGLTGRWTAAAWDRLVENAISGAIILFGFGIVFAIIVRVERAFAKERKMRKPQLSGGRTARTRRPRMTQWGNRKRKRKP